MEYICNRCSYTTTYKAHLKKHLERKMQCKATLQDIDPEIQLNELSIRKLNEITFNCKHCDRPFNVSNNMYRHQKICKNKIQASEIQQLSSDIININNELARLKQEKQVHNHLVSASNQVIVPIPNQLPTSKIGFLYICRPPANILTYMKIGRSFNMYDTITKKGRIDAYPSKTKWFFICKVKDCINSESAMIQYVNLLRYQVVSGKETFDSIDINNFILKIFTFLRDLDLIIESNCNYFDQLPLSKTDVIEIFKNYSH